ncbi:MAG: ATP-binding protein [Clostridia bacterium]|nr:ATP-binding protein [Clostridia bacterium]
MSIRYSKQIFKNVNDAFEQRRAEAVSRRSAHRAEAAQKNARFAAIERELSQTASGLIGAVASGDNAKAAAEAAREKSLALQKERRALLLEYGYPEDYLDLKYTCEKCKDAGFTGSEMCSCYRRALNEEAHKTFNLSVHMPNATFETFDTSLYTGETPPNMPNPRERSELVLNACRKFVHNFGKSGWNLIFTGKNGLGKTHLSSAIAHSLIDEGYDVVYETAGVIFSLMEDMRFGRATEEAEYRTERLNECDLLIIDDLGSEFTTQFVRSALFSIINGRLMNNKSMIISTNLPIEAISELYDERIYSRIAGNFTVLELYGEDIRLALKNK